MPLLLGDIGGTHTRLVLADENDFADKIAVYDNANVESLTDLIDQYLTANAASRQELQIRLAVAAPVTGDEVSFTNLQQTLSADALRQNLQVSSVSLLNDFTAIAYGIRCLLPDDRVQLGGSKPVPGTPLAVLGPGTGLGVSGLIPAAGRWTAIESEGGHVTLAATTREEFEIISRLGEQVGHVSAERLICGPGLLRLFQTLCQIAGRDAEVTTPEQVVARATEGSDTDAVKALDMFFGLLGNVAGNLALTLGARGGVYLAGGILPDLLSAAMVSRLRECFENKGRFRSYLQDIPLYIITHPYPALLGLRDM